MGVNTFMAINEALNYCSGVGYVYPSNEEEYYINSGVNCKCIVNCSDGMFFCEDVGSLPTKNYYFHSPSLVVLENNRKIENESFNDFDDEEYLYPEEKIYSVNINNPVDWLLVEATSKQEALEMISCRRNLKFENMTVNEF